MSQSLYFGQIVIGPAGSGKSTYCKFLQEHAELFGRNFLVVNLDPAAEIFNYRCDVDIRDLITLDDVKEEMDLGPNGGLVFCLEYLLENIDWLLEQLSELNTEDYVLFDCPGQIELYAHLDIMTKVVDHLRLHGFSLCSTYILDSTFLTDNSKFISGILVTLASMLNLGLPHLSVLSKCDLVMDKKTLNKYLKHYDEFDFDDSDDKSKFSEKYITLTNSLKSLIDEYNMIGIVPMDITDDETIKEIIDQIDTILQYDEYVGPKDKYYEMLNEGQGGPAADEDNFMDDYM